MAAKRYREAISKYKTAISIDPSNKSAVAHFRYQRAQGRFKIKFFDGVISDCTEILDSVYKMDALKMRAKSYLARVRYEECITDYQSMLKIKEDATLRKKMDDAYKVFEHKDSMRYNCFILGVERNPKFDEVKKKYKQLSLANHPDKFESEEDKLRAKTVFQRLNNAKKYFAELAELENS